MEYKQFVNSLQEAQKEEEVARKEHILCLHAYREAKTRDLKQRKREPSLGLTRAKQNKTKAFTVYAKAMGRTRSIRRRMETLTNTIEFLSL